MIPKLLYIPIFIFFLLLTACERKGYYDNNEGIVNDLTEKTK